MKLSLGYNNLSLFKKLKDNFPILLWALIGLLALAVLWVIYQDLAKINQLNADAESIQKKIVRVDMEKYRKLEQQLNENASFVPEELPEIDAFKPIPTPIKNR
jgi:thiol:disulfide interchange protein